MLMRPIGTEDRSPKFGSDEWLRLELLVFMGLDPGTETPDQAERVAAIIEEGTRQFNHTPTSSTGLGFLKEHNGQPEHNEQPNV